MNRSCPPLRALTLLLLLVGLSAPAYADCRTEGPSLVETHDYITLAVRAAGQEKFRMNFDEKTGELSVYMGDVFTTRSGEDVEQSRDYANVNLLDCASYGVAVHDESNRVYVLCKSGHCGTHRTGPSSLESLNNFGFNISTDDDGARRLSRALGRYIYLLQQLYKSTHTAPDDPFAKP